MKLLHISGSPRQIQKLRNGHRVRVKGAMEGAGIPLLVDPAKFDAITRSFSRGSASQIQLTPDELQANRSVEGEGIYAGGKLSLKKIGKTISKGLKKVDKAIKSNPVAKEVVKTAVPILAEQATTAALMSMGADPMTAKAVSKVSATAAKSGMKQAGYGMKKEKKVSTVKRVGRAIRKAAKSEIGQELIKMAKPHLKRKLHEKIAEGTMKLAESAEHPLAKEALLRGAEYGHQQVEGLGLYAGRGMLPAPHSRMPEMSSLMIGGSLLNPMTNPALRSDAMGANFHMNTQLPPALQRGVRFV